MKRRKTLSLSQAVEFLEPDAVEEIDSVSLDPLGLSAVATRIAKRLVSTGGRPTDKSWTIAKRVPMKQSTWTRLEEESKRSGRRGLRVAPGQLAAVALERGLEQILREDPTASDSAETRQSCAYKFQREDAPMKAIVAERGQVTIPKVLRHRLGITPKTVLGFHQDNGRLVAEKTSQTDPVTQVLGCLKLDRPTDDILAELRGDT